MNYQGWFKTTAGGEILLNYSTANGDNEKRKNNFIEAAAKAEVETGLIIALNDEGRKRVDAVKAKLQPSISQLPIFKRILQNE